MVASSFIAKLNPHSLPMPTVNVPPAIRAKLYPSHAPVNVNGESLERKRIMVAAIVISLAKTANTFAELTIQLQDNFGSQLVKIGEGASRETYYLPYNLVLKFNYNENRYGDQNSGEVAAHEVYGDLTPALYGHYRSDDGQVNVLIAERVRPLDNRAETHKGNNDYVPFSEYRQAVTDCHERLLNIRDLPDAHEGNIGKNSKGQWVLLDAGIALGW